MEQRAQVPLIVRRRLDVPVAGMELIAAALAHYSVAVHGFDGLHMPPGFAAEGTGIHRQRTADGAGYAGEEFRGAQVPARALAGKTRTRHAGFGMHATLAAAFQCRQRIASGDDHAADATVAHQQIASQTQPQLRHVRRQYLQEGDEIGAVAGHEEQVGRSTDMPGGMARKQLADAHARGKFRWQREVHAAPAALSAASCPASSCAALLMLPAPIIAMTSPGRSRPDSDCAICSTCGTNTGSTLPRPRMARHMARPSAPSMGASPAA